ncbi:MAG: tetratricopeptide repeat protein [Sedimentisphaerales bacterium]|nr:tetratricopeptide repeat protein [Sedimentisphaerales bacterium]
MYGEVLKMKNWKYILAVVAAFTVGLTSIGWSVENSSIRNPSISNPAGVSSVPPSSLSDGLVTSPSPFDRTGNDAMMGNLRGSKSFQGGVPYRSSTAFWGGLASTEAVNLRQVGGALSPSNTLLGPTPDTASLDSFMRNSAGWEDFGAYSGKYTTPQYYSRESTVSTTVPERPGVFKPIDSRVTGTVPDVYGSDYLRNQTLPGQDTSTSDIAIRSTPLTSEEIRRLTSGEARVGSQSEPLDAEQYRKRIEQVRLDLEKMRSKTTLPGRPTGDQPLRGQPLAPADAQKEDLLSLLPKPGVTLTAREKEVGQIRKLAVPHEEPARSEDQAAKPTGLLQTELDDSKGLSASETLDKSPLDGLLWPNKQKEPVAIPSTDKKEAATTVTDLDKLAEQIAGLRRKGGSISTAEPLQVGVKEMDTGTADVSGKYPVTGLAGSGITGAESVGAGTLPNTPLKSYKDLVLKNAQEPTDEVTRSEADKLKSLSDEQVSARAKRILGEYKSHESLNQARYKKYVAEGQACIKQGRYYQAANAYEQASVFDSTQPDAPAGRSLALFCAGEYMSSALFLARAIEMSEEYAQLKVDLAAAVGGNDKLQTRITDAEEWLERSCSPELEFLLAYIYYHSGRMEPATQAIATAAKEMPNSKAVKTLKAAIDAARKPPKQK